MFDYKLSDFKLGKIPEYHPISQKYERIQYWREQKRFCIEGKWSDGIWMPPELYYYINFHNIKFEDDGGIVTSVGLPWLRDIEWEKAYIFSEACGFSGFELDEIYTCNRYYGPEKDIALKYGWVTDEDLKKKKYIPAREYLRKRHKQNLGKALYENSAKNIIDLESRGGGKELPHSEIVITPQGYTTMGALRVGDMVVGKDGKPTQVTHVFPQGLKDVYELELQDGRTVRCGLEHQWEVFDGKNKRILTTNNLLSIGLTYTHTKNGGRTFKFRIDNNKPVEFSKKELPIDPYILGALLGNGTITTNTPKIATSDEFIIEEFKRILGEDYVLRRDVSTTNNHTITYKGKDKYKKYTKYGHNALTTQLREIGVNKKCSEKFIPTIYKFSSIQQRLNILQGLLDTNGSITENGSIEFTNTNERLVDDVIEIARSLGIQCRKGIDDRSSQEHIIKGHTCYRSVSYRAYLKTDMPVFRLPRKLEKIKPLKRRNWVSIVSIKKLDYKEESSCIMVDNEDHTFLTRNYIVTHNSYWLSALILHNFLFDGARDYDKYLDKNVSNNVSESVVGAIDTKYSNDLLNKVKTAYEYLPGSTSITNVFGDIETYPSPLTVEVTGSLAPNKFWQNGRKSLLHHRTFADNPLAANGTRPNRVFLDEVGFFNNLLEAWGAIESTQASAQHKRLVIYATGTGGLTSAGAALYAKEIFYDPESYNCLAFDDTWENKGNIGFFLPATKTLNKFKKGENLITDEKKATEFLLDARKKAAKSDNKIRYLTEIINRPLKPSEIFLRMEGNFFPVDKLKKTLAELESNKRLLDASWKVDLELLSDNLVVTKPSAKKVIREFPTRKGTDLDACIEIFEKPKLDVNNKPVRGRYFIATDPVDDDGNDNHRRSLQSTFVLDSWTNRIVAEYTARTYLASTYYENVRLLCIYYNAKLLYEAHPYSQLVRLPNGKSKLWKDIEIGDTLFGINGTTTKVIDIPVHENIPVYKVILRDGREVLASDSHIWNIVKLNSPEKTELLTTKEMLDYGVKNIHGQYNFFIPNGGLVEYDDKELPIDAYTMGLIISEGSIVGNHCNKNYVQISSSHNDADFYKTIVPYKLKHIGKSGYSYHLYIPNCKNILKNLELLNTRSETKFIPHDYLFNSFEKRLELLKGLMDGDGHAGKTGASIYVTTSERLKEDVLLLCRSMGMNCSYKKIYNKKTNSIHYRINIYTDISIFSLPRKTKDQYIYSPKSRGSKASAYIDKTAIINIEFSHYEMGKCVTVDNPDGLYLIGDYVLTHNCNKKGIYGHFKNKKSLYMLEETPDILKDLQLVKSVGTGNRSLGVNISNDTIKLYAIDLLKEWLIEKIPYGDEEEPVEVLTTIRSVGLLQELIAYSMDINADRVSAMLVMMIYIANRKRHIEVAKLSGKSNINEVARDKFWSKAYGTVNKNINKVYIQNNKRKFSLTRQ